MSMTAYAPLRHPVLKVPYLAFELLTALVRVPCWALLAIPRGWRPRKSWSWSLSVMVKLGRHIVSMNDKVGNFQTPPPNHLALVPGPGYHGVWVSPVPQSYILGKVAMWASVAEVAPIRLPGYWIHEPGSTVAPEAPLMPGEKVIYALHGGGYTRWSAHPAQFPGHAARGVIQHAACVHRTFSIEYRLSSTTPFAVAHPFPTALIDALTGYHYLVSTLHIPPASIVFMGDSAGGNLTLALVRYLVEHPISDLPPPGALLLLSPWADLGTSHETPNSSLITCAASDFLAAPTGPPARPNFLHWSIRAFTGPLGLGAAETNPYISPASRHLDVSFEGFPRTFISAGEAEILRDSIRTLNERMSRDLGEGARYLEAPDSVHDFLLLQGLQEPQRGETLGAIAEWLAEA
ncbi:Alpha/Beta hydrolase protein [Mycena albidolilacea]|uniref:Alpha/Beta hydrolase protein n=1 Tax=Mycena albidolilacea TaxID=1033008 RepID=A0AAD6Z012_9AGAR|nr:Alpha/Beta hydrolase protein [Mycena albidolilacea]